MWCHVPKNKYYVCYWIWTLHIKCITWDELHWGGGKGSLAPPQTSWCLSSRYTHKSIVQYIFNSLQLMCLCFVKGALTLMEHLKPQKLQLQWRQLLLLSPEIKIYLLKKVILSLLLQWIIGVAVLWIGKKGSVAPSSGWRWRCDLVCAITPAFIKELRLSKYLAF